MIQMEHSGVTVLLVWRFIRHLSKGRIRKVIEDLTQAVNLLRRKLSSAYQNRGNAYHRKGNQPYIPMPTLVAKLQGMEI